MSHGQWNVYDNSEPQVASDKRAANPSLNFPNLVADSSSFSNLGQTASNAHAFLPDFSIHGLDNGGPWQTAEAASGASSQALFGLSSGEASGNAASPYQSLEQGLVSDFTAISNQLSQIANQISVIANDAEALESGAFGSNGSGGAALPVSDAQAGAAPAAQSWPGMSDSYPQTGSQSAGSPGAPGAGTTSTLDQVQQQLQQTDPELSQILVDSQNQMSSAGYGQLEQTVSQNFSSGQYPDDASLLQASLQQFQQNGGSASDVSTATNVIQSDLSQYGDAAVSSYAAPAASATASTTLTTQADSTSPAGSTTPIIQAGSPSPNVSNSSTVQAVPDSVTPGAQTDSATGNAPFTLSPQLQQIVSQLGLTPLVSGPVVDNVTGYGGSGATAEPLSDYGTPDGNGGFTITNDPSTWGGDLTPTQSATGTQLFVADVKFNPDTVGTATFDGGSMTSWPAVWANSGQNPGSNLKQEIDTLEYFGNTNDPNAASTLHDWNTSDTASSTATSTPIDSSLFANASTTGVEVASLINDQTNTITNYINGQEVSSFNVNSTDPAETTPISWLLGTGNGEQFDVTNMALFTPATQS